MAKKEKQNEMHGAGGGGGGGGSATYSPDTLYSQDWVELVLAIGEGRMKGLAPGTFTPAENFFIGGTPLYSPGTGETNFPEFQASIYPGAETDPAIKFRLGGAAGNVPVNVDLVQNVPVTRSSPQLQRGQIDRLEVRLLIKQLITQNDKGTFNATADFQIAYKPAKSSTWRLYQDRPNITVTGKTSAGAVQDYLIDVERLVDDDWEIRVTKYSSDNTTTPGTVVAIAWESFQYVQAGDKKYDDLGLVHIFAKITSQFTSLPEMKSIWDGLICKVPVNYDPITRTYDETEPWDGTFKEAWTNSGPWLVHELVTNTRFGLASFVPGVTANRYDFYDVAKWADEPITIAGTTRTQPRFTLNATITEALNGIELLQYLAGSFNSTLIDQGDMVVSIRSDRPTAPLLIVTPEAAGETGFSYSTADISTRYNSIVGRYMEPNLDWATNSVAPSIDSTDWIAQNGLVPYEVDLVGCTDADEAIRRLNYILLSANNETISVAFETSRLFLFADMYETFYVADPDADWSTGGRVKSVEGNLIHLRDPIYCSVAIDCTMRLQAYDGVRALTVRPTVVGVNYTFEVISGAIPTETEMADRAPFTIESSLLFGMAKPFRVVRKETVENSLDKVRITAVEVDMNKYADGDAGLISPRIDYSYKMPGEPVLPPELILESGRAHMQINSDGTIVNRIYANWRRPLNAFTDHYEIDFKEVGTDAWTTVTAYADSAFLTPVLDGAYYVVRLFAVAPITGRRSVRFLERIDYLVAGKTGDIVDAEDFAVAKVNSGYALTWAKPAISDFGGSEIRRGGVNSTWDTAQVVAIGVTANEYLLPWVTEGTHRIFLKHTDRSGNYSANARVIEITAAAPDTPTPDASTRNWIVTIAWPDCTTDQPLQGYFIRWGDADSTPATATAVGNTLGTSFSRELRDPNVRLGFIRAVDMAGNVSGWASFEVGMDDTKDLTPPPQATGLALTAGFSSIVGKTDKPTYKVGHGHAVLNLYAAEGATADPADAELVGSNFGNLTDFPAILGKTYSVWAAWQSVDEVEGPWSDRATHTMGMIGNSDLGDLIIEARNLAENSVGADAIQAGALDATKFASSIEPITIVDSPTLPTVKSTTNISWNGSLYTWDATEGKYKTADLGDITFEDIGGVIVADQIADGVLTASKFADGVEPITIITGGTLPTVKSTTTISFQGKLYRWNGTAYISTFEAGDMVGQIVGTQISDNAITTPKIAANAIEADKIAANAITAGKIAAGAVAADQIAANAITASKIVVADTSNMVPDSGLNDLAAWGGVTADSTIVAGQPAYEQSARVMRWANATGYTGTANAFQGDTVTAHIPVEPGRDYFAGVTLRSNLAGTEGTVQCQIIRVYADGTNNTVTVGELVLGQTTTAKTVSLQIKAPDNCVAFVYRLRRQFSAAGKFSGTWCFYNPVLRRAAAAELIVDGAITADKVAANAITTSKLQVGGSNQYRFIDTFSQVSTLYGITSNATWALTTAYALYGTKSAALTSTTATGYGRLHPTAGTANGWLRLKPNTKYIFSAHVYCPAATSIRLWAEPTNGLSTTVEGTLGNTLASIPAGVWTRVSTVFTTGPSGYMRNSLNNNAITTTYWDGFMVEEHRGDDAPSPFVAAGATTIDGGSITAATIVAGKLAANAVTADNIAANSITTAKIAAGAVSADQIAAGAITASKLVIGDFTNMVPNASFLSGMDGWAPVTGAANATWAPYTGTEGTGVLATKTNGITTEIDLQPSSGLTASSGFYAVKAGDELAVACDVTRKAGASGGNIGLFGHFLSTTGTTSSGAVNGTAATTPLNTTVNVKGTYTVPAGIVGVKFRLYYGSNAASAAGSVAITNISVRRANAVVIEDGSITAPKLAANAIAVGTAAIQDAAITNAMIGNLSADKITTGTLDAARIGAGSIVAGKLAADSVTAINIAANSINASKIQAGTITADKLNVTSLSAITATIGILRTAVSGARMEIRDNLLLAYDVNNVRRVRCGVW